ncbi:MAG: SulP family inorganic anion transporter [Bryobacteraceae bacterium]
MNLFGQRYDWARLSGDCFGGTIAALIALPYGLAMAALMGLPPVMGVFSSILTAPLTGMLGRNPVLVGGPSSVTVPFLAAAVAQQGQAGAAKVTVIAGIALMAFCVIGMGRWIMKVPLPVISGFSCGIGGMMMISQLKTILGLAPPAGGWSESMAGQFAQAVMSLGQTRFEPLVIAVLVVVVATLVNRRSARMPAPLLGVGVACAVSSAMGWTGAEVGALPLGLPKLVGISWVPADVWQTLPSALGLAFVTAANLLITSRLVYHFLGDHRRQRRADHDRELGAYGIANVVAGVFGAPLSVGIPARSLANVRCGGTTPVSNLIHGALLALLLWVGRGWIEHVPLAALAGVTAWIGAYLLDWSTWRRLPKMRTADAIAFLATAIGVQFVNPVSAVAFGVLPYVWPRLRDAAMASRGFQPAASAKSAG